MIGRRSVLAFLGAGPLAAKVAADKTIGQLAGLDRTDGLRNGVPPMSAPLSSFVEQPPQLSWAERMTRAAAFIRNGLPPSLEAEIRYETRYVGALDPDIASKRSWSMAVKINEQRQRNYASRVQSMLDAAANLRRRSALNKMLGFDWPW